MTKVICAQRRHPKKYAKCSILYQINVPIDTPVLCPQFAFTHQSTFTLLSPGFSLAECNCCNLLVYLDIPFGLHTPRDWLLAVSCGTSIPPGKRYLKARSDPGYYPAITTHSNTTHTRDNIISTYISLFTAIGFYPV